MFSATLHIKYSHLNSNDSTNVYSVIMMNIILLAFLTICTLIYLKPELFGKFSSSYKNTKYEKYYILYIFI
jgi:hypothetical protein